MQRLASGIVMLILLSVTGCGYHFSASAPITLPHGVTKIYIRDVNNPTLEGWLDPFLRSRFRDEFTRRAKVHWVSQDQAQAYVDLTIFSYSADTDLAGARGQALTGRAQVILEAEFRSRADNSLLWSSGQVSGAEIFEAGTSEIVAGERAVEEAIRKIADSLGADY
jgi:outer membrane lipopolysaccharide assembly protein LptE/RlpB